MFQLCFKEVSRFLQGSFNGILKEFTECVKVIEGRLKGLSSMIHGDFKRASRMFEWCFMEILMVFPGSVKGVFRKFQENLQGI